MNKLKGTYYFEPHAMEALLEFYHTQGAKGWSFTKSEIIEAAMCIAIADMNEKGNDSEYIKYMQGQFTVGKMRREYKFINKMIKK